MLDLPDSERAGFRIRLAAMLLDFIVVLVLAWIFRAIAPIETAGTAIMRAPKGVSLL
jgi:hypothetical protein